MRTNIGVIEQQTDLHLYQRAKYMCTRVRPARLRGAPKPPSRQRVIRIFIYIYIDIYLCSSPQPIPTIPARMGMVQASAGRMLDFHVLG